jgi:hypothetical protein
MQAVIEREIAKLQDKINKLVEQARSAQANSTPARRDRRTETRRIARRTAPTPEDADSDEDSDWLWGARAIGKFIGRSESQVHYLFAQGYFADACWKLSHKHLIGSRTKLTALADKCAAEAVAERATKDSSG